MKLYQLITIFIINHKYILIVNLISTFIILVQIHELVNPDI